MFRKLQTRLAFGHILPVLVLIPVLSFVLLYLLETRYFLDSFAMELKGQGGLVAAFTGDERGVWSDPAVASATIKRFGTHIPAQISFFDKEGRLLTSGGDSPGPAQTPSNDRIIQQALRGETQWHVQRRFLSHGGVIDVAIPAVDGQGHIVGVVWLEQGLERLDQRLVPLRWMVFITFLVAMIVALVSGFALARSLNAPLLRLTRAVSRLTPGTPPVAIAETGPDEIRFLASSFNQLSTRLYELEEGRRRLLASIVHELGRPLGAIKAAAQVLQRADPTDPEFSREMAAGINSQVDQLGLLIDDMTLLGEREPRDLILHRTPINLPEIVQRQCRSYEYLLQQKQIRLECDLDERVPSIYADETRLAQILANLLHNAYKYTPTNGRICVTVCASQGDNSPGEVLLRVSDTGPGIPEIEQEKIFRLFYRSPNQGTIHQGMGIGLAISQKLAQAHGGILIVESQPGQGATFILRLPVTPAAPAPDLE
jgi:two-component system sensor histidine kinase BaeS